MHRRDQLDERQRWWESLPWGRILAVLVTALLGTNAFLTAGAGDQLDDVDRHAAAAIDQCRSAADSAAEAEQAAEEAEQAARRKPARDTPKPSNSPTPRNAP
ncbi:hypothetical protein [Bailinhaonella thermotolerans]|uniref:Uncharacterized protein n=1 Tax=Bailinhaonella thermotolerans TaxID=1070861 RepID=A0A3A4A3D4_9ACTN|nr:hypothetical protein [Bailinhaonella thermotolerans]RJL19742.1 hypothetical protein D5H75_40155 [Bailinhaonella thermotolerans]